METKIRKSTHFGLELNDAFKPEKTRLFGNFKSPAEAVEHQSQLGGHVVEITVIEKWRRIEANAKADYLKCSRLQQIHQASAIQPGEIWLHRGSGKTATITGNDGTYLSIQHENGSRGRTPYHVFAAAYRPQPSITPP